MQLRLTLLALLSIGPALAQGPNELIRGLCHKEGCDEFRLLEAERVAEGADGTLMRTRIQSFLASPAGRQSLGEAMGYAYCSKARPAILAQRGSQTRAYMIAPFSTEPSWEQRKSQNFVALYFTICHGAEVGQQAVQNIRETALRLRYSVPAEAGRFVDLARAEDMLGTARSATSPPEPRSPLLAPLPPQTIPDTRSPAPAGEGSPED